MTDNTETDALFTPAGSVKITIKSNDYLVRVMRPSANASLHELQLSLKRNRDMLKQSFKAMTETCRDDFFKRVEKKHVDYFSPTQNALVARANIDLLIPLINVKGGIATYNGKLEGMPIKKHIEKLRDKAAKKVRKEESQNRRTGLFIMVIVLLLVGGILWVFF